MSHEVAEANALHIERDGEQYRAFFRDLPLLSGYGSTAAAAERALLDAYRAAWWERTQAHEAAEAELENTRADLETLRQGVTWLGAELDRARRWGALWKRMAKDQRSTAEWWRWSHDRLIEERTAFILHSNSLRRACNTLIMGWRKERALNTVLLAEPEERHRREIALHGVIRRLISELRTAPEMPRNDDGRAD